jgi:serine/threonine-protein kinase
MSEPGTPIPSHGISEAQLRQACADLDRGLRAGEPCRAERFFARWPLLASREDWAVELIYTEFVTREELEQRPTPEEYYARFPAWKERLRRQFQVHELLRDGLAAEAALPAPSAPPPGPRAGERLGGYALLEEVARGGCGVVYRAWQEGLERVVAVKVLRPEFGHLLRARQRFCHEARVMASLRHRHITPVHDIGESRGVIYFSMDWAPGSLARRPGPPDPAREIALLATVARAVQHAHDQEVVHCDLKPSNILLDAAGEPLISDFGLARLPTSDQGADGPGEIVGTPAYMAPEQLALGQPVGPATDVWALGVILYELATGRRPFAGASLLELQETVCCQAPPPFAQHVADPDPRLEAICRRCLDREPGRRFASAAELAQALEHWLLSRAG